MAFEKVPIFPNGKEMIHFDAPRGNASPGQNGEQGNPNRRNIASAAQLRHKTPSRLQSPADSIEHCILVFNPMQHRVGKYGVKLLAEFERVRAPRPHVEATFPGGRNHRGGLVDACHLSSESGDTFGQKPIATTKIEDPLAGPWIKQIQQGAGQIGDKAAF